MSFLAVVLCELKAIITNKVVVLVVFILRLILQM